MDKRAMVYDYAVIDRYICTDDKGVRRCTIMPDSEDILYILNRDNDEYVERAIMFATIAHDGQIRKGTALPYIIHPLEVGGIAAKLVDEGAVAISSDPGQIISAALLHDVLEDTSYGADDIAGEFGDVVLDIVLAESEDKMRDMPARDSWKLRKEISIAKLRTESLDVKLVALCDKLSNMRMSVSEFERKGAEIWEVFNQKNPAEQEWYYRGIAEAVSELDGTWAMDEYLKCLDVIFGRAADMELKIT